MSKLLELHGLTGAGAFVAACATGCAMCGGWVTAYRRPHHLGDKGMALLGKQDLSHFFFSVQRLHGFRQVVQHVSEHVAIGIN